MCRSPAMGARLSRRICSSSIVAHTAPIYVSVGEEPTWKRTAVPGIVAEPQGQPKTMPVEPDETPVIGNEPWENSFIRAEQWLRQRSLLRPGIEKASAAYQALRTRQAIFAKAE